jgi:hypothetical protein
MPRWERPGQADEVLSQVGDNVFTGGMDMKTPDPATMREGTYREGYNARVENGGLVQRTGCLAPGAFNYVQYNQIYGTGAYSDPNGLEWQAFAVSSGVWFVRDGEAPRFIPFDFKLEAEVELVQAFQQLFLFRGADDPPLIWGGDWAVFWEPLPPPTAGRQTIPNADTAEYYANRLLVPYEKDRIAVSDIGDYTQYDWMMNDFQINSGQADSLIRVFPWLKSAVIMFKEHSIFLVSNVSGDLSQTTLEPISSNRGLVGRKAVIDVGNDIFFMDYSGVFQIAQVFENSPQVQALPISDAIKPVINAINWNYADRIRAQARRERVYFAVPLKNAMRPNTLLVYNLLNGCWESIDTFDDPDFRIDDLIRINYNGERRIFAVDRLQGLVLLLEQGRTDIMGTSTAFERQIQFAVLTRGYLGPGTRSSFQRVHLDVAQWNSTHALDAYVDGSNSKVIARESSDRTLYEVWGRAPWDPQNLADDHATPRRQDYSVGLPVRIGYNGIQLEREQETTERFSVGMKGRYCQLRISNTQGFLGVRSIIFDGFEDQRAPRSQI